MLKLLDDQTAGIYDSRVLPHIRIIGGNLDDDPTSPTGLILSGRIDQNTLRFLQVDKDYQRDLSDRHDIFSALRDGVVLPPIEIGVRGQSYEADGPDYIIRDPSFIIDGWQRVGNGLRFIDVVPGAIVRMFAIVYFGSTQEWENKRFDAVNKNRRTVSSDIHLRNSRADNMGLLTLYGLTTNTREFALYKRVCWSQNMQRGDLLKASILAKTAIRLHGHVVSLHSTNAEKIAHTLQRISDSVPLPIFRANVATFFGIINSCWPFSAIGHQRATQLKGSFLNELARMFSDHTNFWDEDGRLVLSIDDKRKLAGFEIGNADIARLAGSGGAARKILYQLMCNHMNSGRRTNRLTLRHEKQAHIKEGH